MGPDSYDCSGLVSYCLLGRHSRLGTAASFMGYTRVSNPKPGDICCNDHHCGIYIGDGQMIHAPRTGDVVKISAVHSGMIYTCLLYTSVARMRGDGLVVSTATGSTAYALSAGGPLVSPGFKGMIAVPLAPHTLRSRAVVTDASDVIEVGFDDTDEFREATLFVDGDIVPFDAPLRKIYVQCAPFDVTLLRADGASFYDRISKDFFGE